MTTDLRGLRIGYVPYGRRLDRPGDRRRFALYASRRKLAFEIANPSKPYDVVVVTENADLSVWSQYNHARGKVVYDFIDSYLAIPRSNLKGRLRGLAKYAIGQSRHLRLDYLKAFEDMCARANAVICTTDEQARDIAPHCRNVHQILDVHSTVIRRVKTDYRVGETLNLVWEGLGVNVHSLDQLRGVLARLQTRHKIALHLLTDLDVPRYFGRYWKSRTADVVHGLCDRVYLYQWNEEMCSDIICASDLAVIPIDVVDPLARGKPENKLVLFWRMGVPTVTSATPAYERAMARARLPMTCRDENEWVTTLEKYLTNESARRAAGTAGSALAKSDYSEDVILQKWDALFRSVL